MTPAGPSVRERLAAVWTQVPDVGCKGLCHECCGPVIVKSAEAQTIYNATGMDMPQAVAARVALAVATKNKRLADCPLLKNNRCSVYAVRPLICRIWGAVEHMRCSHGCRPEKWLDPHRALKLFEDLMILDREMGGADEDEEAEG